MRSITLYVEKDTLIHRMDPISKIVYILFALSVPFILPTIKVAAVCAFLSILLLLWARVLRRTLPVFVLVFTILATVFLIQGLFHGSNTTPAFQVGSLVFYQEGLLRALLLSLRIINITGAFLVLAYTTRPSDLVESLTRKGLSPKIGYVMSSVFHIIPEMMATMQTILDAQRSRGLETEGNLFVRMKSFLPLIGPVVLNSLIQTKERALALEVRGFYSQQKKTYIHEAKNDPYARSTQWGFLLLILAAILWRVFS